MKLGMVGLGKMGGNMAERLRRAGHEVVGFDRDPSVSDAASLADLVDELGEQPRAVWVMVPAGDPTESTVDELAELLAPDDIVVDGGNSRYTDTIRRGLALGERGIGFVDAGTSGGVWGLENGYCLMVGGDTEHVERLRPIFEALAAEEGFAHVGNTGAGHYTKMIHNGIEYGLMQAYAEGYAIMCMVEDGLGIDALAAFKVWRRGSVVQSWLLELLVRALEDNPDLEGIKGRAADSGEGRWTVDEAVRLAVPAPVISSALFARFASRIDDDPAMKVIAALRNQFGGHAVELHE